MQALDTDSVKRFNTFHAKVEIESHILRASYAIMAIQNEIDALINSIVNARKIIVQPQVISPKDLVENLVERAPAFPDNAILPFHFSKDSTRLIYRVSNMQVCISNGILG